MPDKKSVLVSVILNENLTISVRGDDVYDDVYSVVSCNRFFEIWSSDRDIFDLFDDRLSVVTHIKSMLSSISFPVMDEKKENDVFVLPEGFKREPSTGMGPSYAHRKRCEEEASIQVAAYLSQMTDKAVFEPFYNYLLDENYGKLFNVDTLFLTFTAQDAASKYLEEANKAIKEYDKEFEIWKTNHAFKSFSQLDNTQQYNILFTFLCSFIQPWIDRLRKIYSIKGNPLFSRFASDVSVRKLFNISNPFHSHLIDSIRFVYDTGKNCLFIDPRLKRAYLDPSKLSLDDLSHLEKQILKDRAIISYEDKIKPLITDNILFCASCYYYEICFNVYSLIDQLGSENYRRSSLCELIIDSYYAFSSFINSDSITLSFVDQVKTIIETNNYEYAVATCRVLINKLLDWAEGPTAGIDTLIDLHGNLDYLGSVAAYAIDNHNELYALRICFVLSAVSPVIGLMNETFQDIIMKAQKAYSSFDVKSSFTVCADFLALCKSLGYKCEVDEQLAFVLKDKRWDNNLWNLNHHHAKREWILSKLKRQDD